MEMSIRIADDPPLHGFSIGELVFENPARGASSRTEGSARCYMVFVELSVLLHQISQAIINRSKMKYDLAGGGTINGDGRTGICDIELHGFKARTSLIEFLDQLRNLTRIHLDQLVDEAGLEDPLVNDLRDGLGATGELF